MYKIFCIPESKYICGFYQYQRSMEWVPYNEASFDIQSDARTNVVSSIEKTAIRPLMIIGSQHPIATSLDITRTSLRYDSRFFLKQDRVFPTYSSVKEFIEASFSPSFIYIYKEGQFGNDSPDFYANPIEFELPMECFEIHEVDDKNRVIGTAPLCVCIPSKV